MPTGFSSGWLKDFTPRFLIELSPELTLYGNNPDWVGGNRLEQDPLLNPKKSA